MKNFGRVVRMALRYRFTLVTSLVCALGVGVLWGGNIGTIYPFVEIAFQGQSLQKWVDKEIEKSQETTAKLLVEIEQLRRQQADTGDNGQNAIA